MRSVWECCWDQFNSLVTAGLIWSPWIRMFNHCTTTSHYWQRSIWWFMNSSLIQYVLGNNVSTELFFFTHQISSAGPRWWRRQKQWWLGCGWGPSRNECLGCACWICWLRLIEAGWLSQLRLGSNGWRAKLCGYSPSAVCGSICAILPPMVTSYKTNQGLSVSCWSSCHWVLATHNSGGQVAHDGSGPSKDSPTPKFATWKFFCVFFVVPQCVFQLPPLNLDCGQIRRKMVWDPYGRQTLKSLFC